MNWELPNWQLKKTKQQKKKQKKKKEEINYIVIVRFYGRNSKIKVDFLEFNKRFNYFQLEL